MKKNQSLNKWSIYSSVTLTCVVVDSDVEWSVNDTRPDGNADVRVVLRYILAYQVTKT